MFDIFLSYRKTTGTEFCSILKERLSEEGYSVFMDEYDIKEGSEYEQKIEKAISECSYFLVVLATHDLDRCLDNPENDWIIRETRYALKYEKIIIPIKFKKDFCFPDCQHDIKELEYLSKLQLCDLSGSNSAEKINTVLLQILEPSYTKKRKEYHNGLLTKEYQAWEISTMKNLYPELSFVNEFNREFPAVVLEGADNIVYPFEQLNKIENLEKRDDKKIDFPNSPLLEEFKIIVSPNIHFPNLYGFTNTGIILNDEGKITSLRVKPRTYLETVYTTHVLHYELWRAYCDIGLSRPIVMDDLPIRKNIHSGRKIWDVLLSGCNRSALCGVCMSILAYDEEENDYDIAIATRSENVACFPGYLSLVPSGGFELYELEERQTDSIIENNFSFSAALFREYIEELFGDEEFDQPTGNDDYNRLRRNTHIRDLLKAIKNKTCFFEFLGSVLDVTSLRPEFAFVLRIDDPSFLLDSDIKKNKEHTDIRFIPIKKFDKLVTEHNSPLMGESAGVYKLLKNNHLYKELYK